MSEANDTSKEIGATLKRCGKCQRTRADGAVIYRGQWYCTDCRKVYDAEYKRAKGAAQRALH